MKRSERGANLVEFAIILPVLALLLMGVVDMAYAFHDYVIITNAAREGARVASRLPCRKDNATQQQALKTAITNAVAADVVGLKPGGTLSTTITPDPVSTNCGIAAGSSYTVRVTRVFPTIIGGLIGKTNLTLVSQTSMVWFGND